MRSFIVALLLAVVGCGTPDGVPTGEFMQPCNETGSCHRYLICSEDVRGVQMCLPLVASNECGRPGQLCCKSYNVDEHSIAPPCQGDNECRFFCFAGFRCDGSHRTGDFNVCVQE